MIFLFYYFNATPKIQNCKQAAPVAYFAKRNTKFGGGGKRGRAKIPGGDDTPTPFLFARPSVQFWFCRAKLGNHSGFCSKKVLTSSNKHHQRRLAARRLIVFGGPGENRTPVYRMQTGCFATELRARLYSFIIINKQNCPASLRDNFVFARKNKITYSAKF